MSNSFGTAFRITIFGQSHAPAIGVVMEGLPSGFKIDTERLAAFMSRRAPGNGAFSTPRSEKDLPEFISGLQNGITCGAPVTAIIHNTDQRSTDYDALKYIPRPGHADYTAMVKYGLEGRDGRGGGQFSGRLTAPLCIAGGICMQLLESAGVSVAARIVEIGGETLPDKMRAALEQAREAGDSLGGVIECVCANVPAGIGEPMFSGMENRISQAVFAVPAVKGIEFGAGFTASGLRGSENNDGFCIENGKIRTRGNNHGGILGGISSGMPIVFRAAIKPTPSIAGEQMSIDMKTMKSTTLSIGGRHDVCIVPRAVPCIEAAAAIAIYDAMREDGRI